MNPITRRKTAGELNLQCSNDRTKYDHLETAHALVEDIHSQLLKCAEIHDKIINENEFCLVLLVCSDPLLATVRRHKYYAFPFLPQPRPSQVVFLYRKSTQHIKRLWSMPDAKVMATLSEMHYVDPEWRKTKAWCDAFYEGKFWELIRHENNFNLLSESEYLNLHREELIEAGCNPNSPVFADPWDFSKFFSQKVVSPFVAVP